MFKSTKGTFLNLFFAAGIIWTAGTVFGSAAYPDRPIYLIVGFAPGGGTDFLARLIAQKLSERVGQAVIVENKTGADGTIGTDFVAHSKPDGYTLLWVTTDFVVTPSLWTVNYDPIAAFSPIIEVASAPDILLVNPQYIPAKSVDEFVSLAKSKPNQLNFGSTGYSGSPFLEMTLLMKKTGIQLVHVPYKGTALAQVALLGGEIQAMFGSVSGSLEQVRSGKLVALAVNADMRSSSLPDVPTLTEVTKLQGFESARTWFGVLAPTGTPTPIIAQLNQEVNQIVKSPDFQSVAASRGYLSVADNTSAGFGRIITTSIPQWKTFLATINPSKSQ